MAFFIQSIRPDISYGFGLHRTLDLRVLTHDLGRKVEGKTGRPRFEHVGLYRRGALLRYNTGRMATIDKQDILAALMRLGELAAARGQQLDLLLLGDRRELKATYAFADLWEELHGKP